MKSSTGAAILFVLVVCCFVLAAKPLTRAATLPSKSAATTERSGSGYNVVGAPSISASKIDSVLCAAHSPACGQGGQLYTLGERYNIDPAFALAFFNHESGYGLQGVARYSLSLGNLRCITSARCVGGYAYFDSWEQGFDAWYELISNGYVKGGINQVLGRNACPCETVEQIIPVYAPPADDNDDSAYISSVEQMINLYRSAA
jgi:hypothetical protein